MVPHGALPWFIPPAAGARAGRLARSHGGRGTAVAPRMAPSAIRLPDPRLVQLPLQFNAFGPQIFVHEGARQALERRFETALECPIQLAVTDNRHSMITHHKLRGVLRVRVHMMFLDAPDRVLEALVSYVVSGDRESSQLLGEFIEANGHRIRASRPVCGPLRAQGKHHDLQRILSRLDLQYFHGELVDVLVTWGRRTNMRAAKPRKTIKLGSYSPMERLIRVHPALDARWVPRYFVEYIVYHELLHHVVPAVRRGGRNSLHPPEFLRREREFINYERAMAWEAAHIDRLLRSR